MPTRHFDNLTPDEQRRADRLARRDVLDTLLHVAWSQDRETGKHYILSDIGPFDREALMQIHLDMQEAGGADPIYLAAQIQATPALRAAFELEVDYVKRNRPYDVGDPDPPAPPRQMAPVRL